MDADNSSGAFSLQNQTEEFSSRHKSVFDNLPVVKLNHEERSYISTTNAVTAVIEDEVDDEDVAGYKGEESIFKRPMPKLKKPSFQPRKQTHLNRSHVPDHRKNPHKWVKYNLATTSDVTEKSNTAAAFSFLKEIDERKRKLLEPSEPPEEEGDKIVFKKPRKCEETTQSNKVYRDGKLCMPAFEFGSKKSKSNKGSVPNADGSTSGQKKKSKKPSLLSHLDHPDDPEEDEC